MSWLPHFSTFGTCCCEADGEYEGKTLQVRWLGWVFEVTLAKWEDRTDAR